MEEKENDVVEEQAQDESIQQEEENVQQTSSPKINGNVILANGLMKALKLLPPNVKIVIALVIVGLILFLMIILCGAAYVATDYFGTKTDADWLGDFSSIGGGGCSVNGVSLSRDEFINIVKNYKSDSGYQTRFAQYAGVIYDICKDKNINPVLVVAQAAAESNFGASVPSNSRWNYWGIGVYNGSSTGTQFSNIEEAVTAYCNILLGYQSGNNSIAVERSKLFATVNSNFSNSMSTIYDIYSAYMWLGDYHSGHMWYVNGSSFTAKQFLNQYIPEINCNHGYSDPTTVEEQAAYVVWYVNHHIKDRIEKIFGTGALICRENNSANTTVYEADGGYMAAVVGNNKYVSCPYADTTYHTSHWHRGTDIAAASGTEIISLGSGKVERSEFNSARGYYVRINHGNGYQTLYQHCSKLLVNVGDTVKKGQVIALVGSTGQSSGPHLHLEVWVPHGQGQDNWGNQQWDVTNPEKFNYSLLPG